MTAPPFILHPRRRPIIAPTFAVNWRNPITKGLCFLFGSDPNGTDLVTGARGVGSGTTPPVFTSFGFDGGTNNRLIAKGNGISLTNYGAGGSGALSFGTHKGTEKLTSAPPGATFFFYMGDRNPGSGSGTGLAGRNDNNVTSAGWAITQNTGTFQFVIERASQDMRCTCVFGEFNNYLTHTLAITTPGDLVNTNVAFYLDGHKGVTTAGTVGSGTIGDDTAQSLVIGQSSGAGTGTGFSGSVWNGHIQIAAIFRRVLSRSEIGSLSAFPLQLFNRRALPTFKYIASGSVQPHVCAIG